VRGPLQLGTVTTPECQVASTAPHTLYLLKFGATHVLFLLFIAILRLVALGLGTHSACHAKNTIKAIYTMCVVTLARSCVRSFDCSRRRYKLYLDAMPDFQCTTSDPQYLLVLATGAIGLLIYCAIIPTIIYIQLRRGHKEDALMHQDFLEQNGWFLLCVRTCLLCLLSLLAFSIQSLIWRRFTVLVGIENTAQDVGMLSERPNPIDAAIVHTSMVLTLYILSLIGSSLYTTRS
jgi:hypothetical protein